MTEGASLNGTLADDTKRVFVANHSTSKDEVRRISFSPSKVPLSANKNSVQEEMGLIVLLISVSFVIVVVLRWKPIIGQRIVVLFLFLFFVCFIITVGITEDRWKKLIE